MAVAATSGACANSRAPTSTPRPPAPSVAGSSSTNAPPQATTPATTAPVPAPGCSNLGVVASWPVARAAAQLVVAPALNFDSDAVRVAVNAGAGGILFLGGAP